MQAVVTCLGMFAGRHCWGLIRRRFYVVGGQQSAPSLAIQWSEARTSQAGHFAVVGDECGEIHSTQKYGVKILLAIGFSAVCGDHYGFIGVL